jgi:cyclophilin family peptidyl-prolyl cis-trans isomerase
VFVFQTNIEGQVVTNQPQNVTVNSGSTATFTVGVSDALSYQWQFNGSNLTDAANITGSTNSALTLEDVDANEAGTYTVLLNGSVPSSNAVLTVLPGTIVTFTFSGLLPGAPGSSLQVQLFDHDKPVTVQNFLHYISAGAYTNMFFDRCVPGFVLQGGDYGASDQTNGTPPITGWSIEDQFTYNSAIEPPFPYQISSEFGVGPLVHNRFGTIAMALSGGDTNSASSAFFFNLADNSGYPNYLDTTNNGPFTVFGRVIDQTNVLNGGTNLLNYFNTLTTGGIIPSAEFLNDGFAMIISNVPVNYGDASPPANSELVYCAFQLAAPPGDTNLPAISITTPTGNSIFSNLYPVTVQGTVSDPNNIGIAWVRCDLIPLPAEDGRLPNGGVSLTNYVVGATNWSLTFETVPPGTYELGAQAQDEAGNLSSEVFLQPLIVSAIVINGDGTVTFTSGSSSPINAVGYPLQNGSNYDFVATPGTNQLFVSWTAGEQGIISPDFSVSFNNFLLTATFISNGIPNSIAFVYPTSNALISNQTFNVTGTFSNVSSTPVTVTCYIYSTNSYYEAGGSPLTTSGTTNWSVTVSNIPFDNYSLEAVAVDAAGRSTVISEYITVSNLANLQLNAVGPGTVSGATNGESFAIGSTFQVTATPDAGQLFYAWTNGSGVFLNPVQTITITSDLALTAIFITNSAPNMIAFTYPKAGGIIGPVGFNIMGTISNDAPVSVTCDIFSNMVRVGGASVSNGTTEWAIAVPGLGVGAYTLVARAGDLVGHSTLIDEDFTVAYAGALGLVISGKGSVGPATNGESLPLGQTFQVTATPEVGEAFYTWGDGTRIFGNATQTFTMASGLTLTATFVPSNTAKGISFTYPAANASVKTNTFPLRGKIAPSFKPAGITCRIFQTGGLAVGPALTTSGTQTWSVMLSNLPGGSYYAEALATNAAGLSTIASEKFTVSAFAAVAGTYSGLFICANNPVAPTNSGMFTFSVNTSGTFSGNLTFPAYAPIPIYSVSFANLDFAEGFYQFGLDQFHGKPLQGVIYLDLSSGSDFAVGTNASDTWVSPLVCFRATTKLSTNTTPAIGKYILSLQTGNQTNGPTTNGYASVVLARNGVVAVSGALPDNTTFSRSTRISKDGWFPICAVPAGDRNKGMLIGWGIISNSGSCSGQLDWYKAPDIGIYYASGVGGASNLLVTLVGTNYSRPAIGEQYSIIFQGGTILTPLTNSLVVDNARQFTASDAPPDKLTILLSANGIITGSVVNPNDKTTLRFKGAFISPSEGGSGFIPEPGGQTGCFALKLKAQ